MREEESPSRSGAFFFFLLLCYLTGAKLDRRTLLAAFPQPLVHLFTRRLDLVKQLGPERFDNAAQDRRAIDDFVRDDEKTNLLELVIVHRLMHKRRHICLRTCTLQTWHCPKLCPVSQAALVAAF